MTNGPRWHDLAIVGWVLLLLGFYVKQNLGYALDDSYITYRYAANAASGYGLAFNPGERHFGSTAMGYAVLLAVLAKASAALGNSAGFVTSAYDLVPTIATILSAAALGCSALVCAWLARRIEPWWARGLLLASLAVVLFAGAPSRFVAGHETLLFVALLLLGSVVALVLRRPVAGGLLLAVATAVRPDAALFAVLVFASGAIGAFAAGASASARRFPVRFGGAYAALVLPWVALLTHWFGSPLPETLTAKRVQIALGFREPFTLTRALQELTRDLPWTVLVLLAAAPLLGLLARSERTGARAHHAAFTDPLATFTAVWSCFAVGLVAAYCVLGVSFWRWYVYPAYFGLLFLAVPSVIAIQSAARDPASRRARAFARLAGGAVIGVLVAVDGPNLARALRDSLTSRNENPHVDAYRGVVAVLRASAVDGASLATPEPGAIGYYLGPRFHVVDELGLTSPGVARALARGDLEYGFRTEDPTYVVVSWDLATSPHDRAWFRDRYELVGEFEHPHWQRYLNRSVRLYARAGTAEPHALYRGLPVFTHVPGAVLYATRVVDARCEVDMVDATQQPREPVDVQATEPLGLNGWAIDAGLRRAPDRLFVRFAGDSGRYFSEIAGRFAREDLARRYGRTAAVRAGWHARLDVSSVPPGVYEIAVLVVSEQGEALCETGRSVRIVTAEPSS